MWLGIDRLFVRIFDSGLAAMVLLGAVAIGMVGLRQPARRLRLARAGLVGALALVPLIGFGLVPRIEFLEICERLGASSSLLAGLGTDFGVGRLVERVGPWPGRVFTMVYLGGVGIGLARLAISGAAVWWVRRIALEPSQEAAALYESLPYSSGKRRPLLRVSPRMRRPALLGVRRPLILIPTALERPESTAREQLRLSLLHELAHAEAADPWFGLLGNLARALWFPVPPLWWIGGQIRNDQEFLADRRAANHFGPPSHYAASLIDIAAHTSSRPESQRLARVPEDRKGSCSPLFLRVLMLIRCPFPIEERPPRWWAFGTLGLAAFMTLSVSVVAIRPRHAAASASSPHADGGQTFRMTRLRVPPIPANLHGRIRPIELPIPLPDRFKLTLEVWAKPADLAQTRVAGLPLEHAASSAPPETSRWHKVAIQHRPGILDLAIDGENIPILASPGLVPTRTLSFELAPDATGQFRNLTLSW